MKGFQNGWTFWIFIIPQTGVITVAINCCNRNSAVGTYVKCRYIPSATDNNRETACNWKWMYECVINNHHWL